MQKHKVLVLVGAYLPGFKAGGPLRSIENLVNALGQEFAFRIVTLDRDLGDKSPYAGIVPNQWIRSGNADVIYIQPGFLGLLRMWALLRSVDQSTVLYINSFFARNFSLVPVIMRWLKLCEPRCLVLAPRGEFSLGALRLKHTRKLLYLKVSRWIGLYQGVVWHASSDFEATDIYRQLSTPKDTDLGDVTRCLRASSGRRRRTVEVAIASDIANTAAAVQRQRLPKVSGQLCIAFVSRLTRKKNLAGALKMLESVAGAVSFNLYGPLEDPEYWAECEGLIAALPPNILVRYRGQIEHHKIYQVFADHDLFLFPTLGENYGHVICEALSSGCPVLISDQTPWRGLEGLGVGWDLPLCEPARFREVVQECVDMGPEEHAAMRARAAEFGAKCATDPAVIEQNRALFRMALHASAREYRNSSAARHVPAAKS